MYPTFYEQNISTPVVNTIVNKFMRARQRAAEQIQLKDTTDQTNAIRDLKELWGGEYQGNMNRVNGVLARMPEEVREALTSARTANGTGELLFNVPGLLQFLEADERARNPAGTVVPNANNPVQAIADRITALEARMGDDDWHSDTEANEELMGLYQAREDMAKQG
jgi:hypothetical protein